MCCRTLEELLLELSLCDFDLDGLVDLLLVAPLMVGIVLDGRGEQRVDEGGLAEAGLASNLYIHSRRQHGVTNANLSKLWTVKRTIIVKAAPLFATILCRWLGRLAMPIGEALSLAAGDILYSSAEHETGR